MGVKSYKELEIWKKGIDIVNCVYKATSTFPKEELYGITAQMRRSSVSIPANIAEGFARQHNREYRQFLYVALGSCAELETQIIVGLNQNLLIKEDSEKLLEHLDHEARMLMNMVKSVSKSLTK